MEENRMQLVIIIAVIIEDREKGTKSLFVTWKWNGMEKWNLQRS